MKLYGHDMAMFHDTGKLDAVGRRCYTVSRDRGGVRMGEVHLVAFMNTLDQPRRTLDVQAVPADVWNLERPQPLISVCSG